MLTSGDIAAWAPAHPWATNDQIEQDLLLSRAICAIASDSYLGKELVFRGGTALHKLHFPEPLRYSEDLDYVRATGDGIGRVLDTLKNIGRTLGFDVRSTIGMHPKVFWRTISEGGLPLRLKIEMNTHERSPALPYATRSISVDSPWWTGTADVKTFQLPELVATKIRALFQRSKGRDLFDMWLALTVAGVDPKAVVVAFEPYRPDQFTAAKAITNLHEKLTKEDFRHDLDELTAHTSFIYDIDVASELIITAILRHL